VVEREVVGTGLEEVAVEAAAGARRFVAAGGAADSSSFAASSAAVLARVLLGAREVVVVERVEVEAFFSTGFLSVFEAPSRLTDATDAPLLVTSPKAARFLVPNTCFPSTVTDLDESFEAIVEDFVETLDGAASFPPSPDDLAARDAMMAFSSPRVGAVDRVTRVVRRVWMGRA
jgi:hypothetical protein